MSIRKLMALSLMLGAPAWGSAAFAQETAEGQDDIVVTATRTPTALERVPVAVEVIDREEIENRGYVSVAQAINEAPGVIAVQNGTPGSLTSVFSRGTNSKHTLALYDGIRLNDASTPNGQYNFGQDLLGDLERVEVLRGAASSIYGSDAIGGVVNLIPRRGAESPFAPYYEVSAGSMQTFRGVFGAAGTLGNFSYGVTAEGYRTEGFNQVPDRFALVGSEDDGARIATLSGTVRYDITQNVAVDALVRYRRASSDFDTFSGGASGSLRADDPDLEVARDIYLVSRLGLDVNFGPAFASRLSLGVVDNEREERNGGVRTSKAEGERTFADFVNTWTPGDRGMLRAPAITFGASWIDEEIDVAATAFAGRLARSESTAGVFLIGQSGFGDYLDVTASVRQDDSENFGSNTTYNVGAVVNFSAVELPLGAGLRLRANYGTSFKAPTLNERFSTSAFNLGNPNLRPEEGEGYEVGFEVDLFPRDHGAMVGFGFTWFDNEVTNLIEYNFAQLRNINIGRVEIEGSETFIEFAPTDWVDLRITHTFTESVNAVLPSRPQLLRRPNQAYGLQLDVRPTERLDLGLTWTRIGSRTDVNYSNAGAFVASGRRIQGYDVGSVTANYTLVQGAELFGSVTNVTDEVYEQPEAFAGAPRAVYIGLRGRF
jgi:vitamin B12 transporter